MAGVIVEKRGSVWRYVFEMAKEGGKRRRKSESGFATKKEAQAAGNKAFAEYNGGGVIFSPSELSFSDFLDEWMERYCKVNLKPETVAQYEKKIRVHIKPALGKYKLTALSPSALQQLIDKLFNKGYSRNTLVVIKGILTGSLRYAVEPLRYIQHSPAVYIRLPSYRAVPDVPSRSEPHVYIPKERFQQIIRRFPEGHTAHLPLMLGYKCGMRLSEVFGLCVDDVDFENRTISINRQMLWDNQKKSWYISPPKYESIRTIDADTELLELIQRTIQRHSRAEQLYEADYQRTYEGAHGVLISTPTDTELHFLNRRDNGAFVAPRIMQHASHVIHTELSYPEFDFHSFRHTHATMLAEAGAPIKYTQLRLGHKNVEVTLKIYQKLSQGLAEQGAVALEQIFKTGE